MHCQSRIKNSIFNNRACEWSVFGWLKKENLKHLNYLNYSHGPLFYVKGFKKTARQNNNIIKPPYTPTQPIPPPLSYLDQTSCPFFAVCCLFCSYCPLSDTNIYSAVRFMASRGHCGLSVERYCFTLAKNYKFISNSNFSLCVAI